MVVNWGVLPVTCFSEMRERMTMAMKSLSTWLLGQKSRSNMARERRRKSMKLILRAQRPMTEKSCIWSITMGGM